MTETHIHDKELAQCSEKSVGHAHSGKGQASVQDTWEEGCGGGACEYCMCCRGLWRPRELGWWRRRLQWGTLLQCEDNHKAFALMPLQYSHVTLEGECTVVNGVSTTAPLTGD